MNSLEIVLLIVGIIIIVISCRLVESAGKKGVQPTDKPFPIDYDYTEADKIKLMEKLEEMIAEVREETIIRTDDALSKLSNEKIMAVNEFSDQILEKIKHNHEEVVFLYSMLNDKEKELKAAVREIDFSKKKVQDIMESKAENDKMQVTKNIKNQTSAKPLSQAAQMVKNEKTVKAVSPAAVVNQDLTPLNSLNSNNNTQILELYSHGRSVMEISKLLGMGQGEVKLVIDLFKGKK